MARLALAVVALFAVAFAQQGGPPPFLEGASPAVLQQFQQLLGTLGGKTEAQAETAVKAFVTQAGFGAKYAAYEAEVTKQQQAGEAAHRAAIAAFSPAAKALDAQLTAIADHPGLSVEQKGQQIQALLASANPAARAEVEKAMQG